jgi:hypothetical protein
MPDALELMRLAGNIQEESQRKVSQLNACVAELEAELCQL